jgi:hypothetical protein
MTILTFVVVLSLFDILKYSVFLVCAVLMVDTALKLVARLVSNAVVCNNS